MSSAHSQATQARRQLHEILDADVPFVQKARRALTLGTEYLDVDSGLLTRVDTETGAWEAVVSTDPDEGEFPTGLNLDLESTYCRRALESGEPVALAAASRQGWADDIAVQTHGLQCYHGSRISIEGEWEGTVCFVAREAREDPFSDERTMFAELLTGRLERELEQIGHAAELARRAALIGVLNRVLRHNLRNDMSVVRGRLEHLAAQNDAGDHAQVAIDRIDDLLALCEKARRLAIQPKSERADSDATRLTERAVASVRRHHPDATVTTAIDADVTAPLYPTFERAIEELLENAAKHAGPAARIHVTLSHVPHGVELTVADDGPGIPPTEQQLLAKGGETPLSHGTGIGLWLVNWIATSHDGSIDVEVSDAGSTVRLFVPRSLRPSVLATTDPGPSQNF